MIEVGTSVLLTVFGVVIGILATLLIQARCRLRRKEQPSPRDEASIATDRGSQAGGPKGNQPTTGNADPKLMAEEQQLRRV